jgi:hypothetical protein
VTGEHPQVFERGSNVHEYWLAHAEGFHVVSRRKPRARVDHVVVDRQLGSATALVVKRKRSRRAKRIPVMWVSGVDPFERLLYLTPRRRAQTAALRLRPHVVDAARGTWRAQSAAREWARPRAVEAVAATQRECVRGARWLRPRLVGAGDRAVVMYARGYRAASAFLQRAYAWLRPRVVLLARRAVHGTRAAATAFATRLRAGSVRPQSWITDRRR